MPDDNEPSQCSVFFATHFRSSTNLFIQRIIIFRCVFLSLIFFSLFLRRVKNASVVINHVRIKRDEMEKMSATGTKHEQHKELVLVSPLRNLSIKKKSFIFYLIE